MSMSFTILYALLALLIVFVIFFVVYRVRGLKSALIVTGITFFVLAVMLVEAIGMIVNAMPN